MNQLPGTLEALPADVPGLWEALAERLEGKAAPRFVIHGGYGKNNMGDDALLHVLRGRVLDHFPNARITVVCHGPERVAARYPGITALYFKDRRTLAAARASDVYIIGGGGIVNRTNAYSGNMVLKAFDPKGKFQFLAASIAKASGAFTIYYAIGVESFPDAVIRLITRWGLNRADIVSVRDPHSLANLRSIGVQRAIVEVRDPGLSLEPASPETAEVILSGLGLQPKGHRQRPLVGLNFRWMGDPAVDNEATLREAARLVGWLREHGCDVVFLPTSQHPNKHLEDDLDFGRRLKEMVGDEVALLDTYPHPTAYMALFGQMDALIGTRFHSIVLSTRMNVPIVAVCYDAKVSEFMKLAGAQEHMIDLKDFTVERLTPLMQVLLKDTASGQ